MIAARAITVLALSTIVVTPAAAQSRDRATVLMSENPGERQFQEQAGYSDAVVIDGTVYLSGVVTGFGPGPGETLEAAYERTFVRLGKILERAGASWGDVVDITSFHTDLTTQLGPIAAVKNRYVKAPFPAWTAIGVSRLVPDRGVTEIKLVAKLPAKRGR